MLEDFYNEHEKKRKAHRRGHVFVWYILLPLAVLFALWQWRHFLF